MVSPFSQLLAFLSQMSFESVDCRWMDSVARENFLRRVRVQRPARRAQPVR